MSFVKKWLSTIISFVAGVCGLALSACSGLVMKIVYADELKAMGLENMSDTTKAFKVLTDGNLYKDAKDMGIGSEFMVMKVFAIITLIVSILLIAYAVVMLLKNLNVIKLDGKIFDYIGLGLFALLLVATVGLMISSTAFADAMKEAGIALMLADGMPAEYLSLINIKINVGVYQIAMLVISIISAVAVGTFTFLNKKKA